METLKRLFEDENGQGMTEYALMLVLVMLLVISTYVPVLSALMSYYKFLGVFVALPIP